MSDQTQGNTVDIKPTMELSGIQTDAERAEAAARDAARSMTQAQMHAQAASISAADVSAALAAPAPTSELHQRMQQIESRLGNIETMLQTMGPIATDGVEVLGAAVPALHPLAVQMPNLIATVEGILTSLHEAFGGKAPSSLPAVGSATAPPPAVASSR